MMHKTKNITLIGMPGSGKTVIARELAKLYACAVIDADEEIILAAGRPITDIFQDFGEEDFRDGERRVIERLLKKEHIVLSAGGGAYIQRGTRKIIDENSISVWLDVDFGVLWRRIKGKRHRPMLQGVGAKEKLQALYDARTPIYAEAQIHVKYQKMSPQQTAEKIAQILHGHTKKAEQINGE